MLLLLTTLWMRMILVWTTRSDQPVIKRLLLSAEDDKQKSHQQRQTLSHAQRLICASV